ncbi:DUF202 domain-containing protein [Pseudarthrobacter sp. PS3-L1]|uniref:DUF202 domain-containing protein n=1 Tax=Pseudarthrobacter sp. PS3-L1 TaxID=3046207 RepID=UPI0024BA6B74|nr:DUF202 domain-containing protein [Pseudarthrobacter sp. PS3-L1]MDJ0319169.1 DUF202 domain-containing protein [Pseudarthrobacter sp. PS3-L1]
MPQHHGVTRAHQDPGLQPERTSLAWGRTLLALVTVSSLFLRWVPLHGWLVLGPLAMSITAAASIYATQRRRYQSNARGISAGQLTSDGVAVLWTAVAAAALGAMGVTVVLLDW